MNMTTLDGRTFSGVVLDPGKTTGDEEVISFRGGMFHSSACVPYGYGDGSYKVQPAGDDSLVFDVETSSPQYGRLLWHGRIEGHKLDGTLTMLRGGDAAPETKWVVAGEQS